MYPSGSMIPCLTGAAASGAQQPTAGHRTDTTVGAGHELLERRKRKCFQVSFPPGIVISYTLLLAVVGYLHGAGLWSGETDGYCAQGCDVGHFPPVVLERHPLRFWARHAHRAYIQYVSSVGRTARWLQVAAAAQELEAPTSADAADTHTTLSMNSGEFSVSWAFESSNGSYVHVDSLLQAAAAWIAGDDEAVKIPRPTRIRFQWSVRLGSDLHENFDGYVKSDAAFPLFALITGHSCLHSVWGGIGFGTGMAGSDLMLGQVEVSGPAGSVLQVSVEPPCTCTPSTREPAPPTSGETA